MTDDGRTDDGRTDDGQKAIAIAHLVNKGELKMAYEISLINIIYDKYCQLTINRIISPVTLFKIRMQLSC